MSLADWAIVNASWPRAEGWSFFGEGTLHFNFARAHSAAASPALLPAKSDLASVA